LLVQTSTELLSHLAKLNSSGECAAAAAVVVAGGALGKRRANSKGPAWLCLGLMAFCWSRLILSVALMSLAATGLAGWTKQDRGAFKPGKTSHFSYKIYYISFYIT
jgi:hypothetical protein